MPKLSINGTNIYFEDVGNGYPILLSHGYNSNHYEWELQMPMLAKKYRVIAIDHRGHGFSDVPSLQNQYSISIFANDIYGILSNLQIDKCYMIGQSMGGFVALQFINDFPEMISALVLVSTCAEVGGMSDYDRIMKETHAVAREKGLEAAFEYSADHDPMLRHYLAKYPDKREAAKQKLLNNHIDGYVYSWNAISKWQGVVRSLSKINVPTEIFVGEEDNFILRMSEKMAKNIARSNLNVIPDVGHSIPEEAPYTFNKMLSEFLLKLEV